MWLLLLLIIIFVVYPIFLIIRFFIKLIIFNFFPSDETKDFKKSLKNYRSALDKERANNRNEFINQWKDKK